MRVEQRPGDSSYRAHQALDSSDVSCRRWRSSARERAATPSKWVAPQLVVENEYDYDPFQADRVTINRSCFGSCSRSGRFAIVPCDVVDKGDVCEPGEAPPTSSGRPSPVLPTMNRAPIARGADGRSERLVTRGSGIDEDAPSTSSEPVRNAERPAAAPLDVTVLSSDARPTAGWGMFTTQVCRALSARGDVRVNLLLPHGVPSALDGDVATTQSVLPPADRSFRRHPWNLGRHVLRPPSVPKVDIVHALVEFPYALDAAAIARRRAVPFMISAQGTYAIVPLQRPPDRWFYSYALRQAALVTVPSKYTRDALLQALGRPARVELLANGVDPGRFANGGDVRNTRARFGLPSTATVLLSVGALKRRKGFDVLLRAFATVREARPGTYLVIVGTGDQTGLRALAAELGVSDNVRLTGELSESDVVDLYHACTLFAMLPRCESGHFEGFGLVYLEAGACAKPVVGTRSGGVPGAVVHGETGFLVEEEDATAAAHRMLQVLNDPRLAHALGESGRKWAQQHAWVRYADRLVGMYRAMLLSRSQSGRPT